MIMTKDIKLRKATEADREFTYQTVKSAYRNYVEQVWGWDEEQQRKLQEEWFTPGKFKVILAAGVDVGFLGVVHEPDCIRLKQIYLLLEHQNRGIGTACLTRILEEADALGLPVRLGVLKVNPRAMALYRRLGFQPTGENETHVQMKRPLSRQEPKENCIQTSPPSQATRLNDERSDGYAEI